MANVVLLNDHAMVLRALAAPLLDARHRVLTELSPIDWEQVVHFGPDVLVAGLTRIRGHAGNPILDFVQDVAGARAFMEIKAYPAIKPIPTIVVGIGVDEQEIPLELGYDLFLYFPDEMDLYLPKVQELSQEKRKRKISGYLCPAPGCSSRLLYRKDPPKDLYCPKCGTSVAITDSKNAIWMDLAMVQHRCKVGDLLSPLARDG